MFLQRKWHYSLPIRFWGHRKVPSFLNVSNGKQKEETFFNWPASRLHSVNMTTLSAVYDTFKSSRGFLIDFREGGLDCTFYRLQNSPYFCVKHLYLCKVSSFGN